MTIKNSDLHSNVLFYPTTQKVSGLHGNVLFYPTTQKVSALHANLLFMPPTVDPVISTIAEYSEAAKHIRILTSVDTVGDRGIMSYGTYIGTNVSLTGDWIEYTMAAKIDGGQLPWYVVENKGTDGGRCLRSGAITHNQTSSLSIVIEGPTIAHFDARGSGETNYDKLGVYLDNVQQGSFLSENATPYVHYDLAIPIGTHTLRFTFQKDYGVSAYEDCGYVDNLIIDSVDYVMPFYDQIHEVSYSSPSLQSIYDTDLLPGKTYYCRSFVKTGAKVFYGPVVSAYVKPEGWSGNISGIPSNQIAGIAVGNTVLTRSLIQKVVVGDVLI